MEGGGDAGGGMDLDGEAIVGVEEFQKQGEAGGVGDSGAEDIGTAGGPEIVEGLAAERIIVDDALGFGAVDDFPGFADAAVEGESLAEVGTEPAATPDAVHEDRLEDDGSGKAHS